MSGSTLSDSFTVKLPGLAEGIIKGMLISGQAGIEFVVTLMGTLMLGMLNVGC